MTSSGNSSKDVRPQLGVEAATDALIAQARNGDAGALDRLIELLSEHLWAELGLRRKLRGLGPSHGLSDLVQDTLLRIREKFALFERDTFADLKRWARKILFRRWQEWARNHRVRNQESMKQRIGFALRARLDPNRHDIGQDELAERRQEAERAYAAFKRLKTSEQFIINLRLIENLRYAEIAILTNSSVEAARTAYRRAIAQLKRVFDDDGKR